MRLDRIAIAAAAAGICTFLNVYTPQAILPALAAAFGVAPARTGQAITAALLSIALVAPFAGAVSDVLGRKRLIVIATVLLIVPTLLVATAQSFAALLVWRFVQGLLLPFVFTVVVAYISEECDGPEAIRVTGIYSVGAVVGGFAGRFITGVAADLGGWRIGFATTAAATALLAIVIMLVMPRERRFRPIATGLAGGVAATLHGWREHVVNRRLWGTCAVGAAMLFSVVATFTFINLRLAAPPILLSPAGAGAVFAVYLVGVVTTPAGTWLAVRIGRASVAVTGAVLALAGELVTLAPGLPVIVVGLMLTCAGLFVVQSLALGFVGVAAPRARSSAVGLYVSVYYIGGALGAVLPAAAWHRAGWPGCVTVVSVVVVGMGLASAVTFRRVPA